MIIGSNIQFYGLLESTNTYTSECLKVSELQEGTVIYADFQTAGKGHQGNRWESENGKNLIFSIILYPSSVRPEDQFLISMAISLGISDFLQGIIPEVKIKWPNDIYVKDDKIAGILIENTLIGDTIESSVAGIGLNINQEKFSSGIPNPVSIKLITGKESDIRACLKQLLNSLDSRYKQLLYGDRQLIRDEYISLLYRAGEWHEYSAEGKVFRGMIKGISATGNLEIERKDRSVNSYSFKEVEYLI